MKIIKIKIGIVFFLFSLCSTGLILHGSSKPIEKPTQILSNDETLPQEQLVYVEVTTSLGVEQVELSTYLLGVVAGEMPVSFELEALKAQVVASRTFVFSRDLKVDNTTNSQVYLSKEERASKWLDETESNESKIIEAIEQTDGEVLMYDGEYISALFFSSSNGHTENNEDYFVSSAVPYLRSVESPWDQMVNENFERTKTFTTQQLAEAFSIADVNFTIVSHKSSGRVDVVYINDKEYSGRQVREILNLASNDFTIDKTDEGYVFTTKGSGHGVGMSQYGAQGMALEGKSYEEILNHYYTNIEIVKK